jgi:hypothetical protein
MRAKLFLLLTTLLLAFNCLSAAAQVIELPRVGQQDLEYLGAFSLPSGTYGESRFGFSGKGLAIYRDPASGKDTLFIEGHAWDAGNVAQVQIPDTLSKSETYSELPVATVLQNFFDIADDKWASTGQTSYLGVYGMLAYNGRLIVAATSWYDASCSQRASHGVSTFDLSQTNDFQGFYSFDATANSRSLGGYMTLIPEAWRSLFGGPALTGNSALSIISCISSGPAATVFDPDHVGTQDPIPGSTVVYYPLSNYLKSGGMTEENTFTFGSSVKGIAFPEGSKSVLFFGVQTLADGYCYGPGTNDPNLHKVPTAGGTYCYDLCSHSKGGHGYPYYHYVWAYDANHLLQVKNGTKEPWEIEPYAAWRLNEMNSGGCAGMRSAAYDQNTRRVYITQSYGEQPKVDVYQINAATGAGPNAPTNLRIQ